MASSTFEQIRLVLSGVRHTRFHSFQVALHHQISLLLVCCRMLLIAVRLSRH